MRIRQGTTAGTCQFLVLHHPGSRSQCTKQRPILHLSMKMMMQGQRQLLLLHDIKQLPRRSKQLRWTT